MADALQLNRPLRPAARVSRHRGGLFWSGPRIPPWVIVGVAVFLAAGFGRFLADGQHHKYAAAIMLAALFGPVAFFDLATALAIWGAILFVQDLRILSSGPNAMGVIVGLGWIGAFVARSGRLEVLKGHRRVLLATILFAVWMTLSVAWARSPGVAASGAGYYWLSALVLLVVITTVRTSREVAVVAFAFVLGALAAAVVGLASGGLNTAPATAAAAGQTAVSGRLTGGGGDPNLQAAAFIAAMFVSVGLIGFTRRRGVRIGLLAALAVISVAFFATQSRGGLLALVTAAIAAVLVSPPRQRRRIMGVVLLIAAVGVAMLSTTRGEFARITNFGGGTSGRNDIWRVAWLVFEHHPVAGVGANNFSVVEPNYALDITNATRVSYIAEQPLLFPAHNSYLQMLTDVGVIGLIAYLAVIVSCLRAGWLASRTFDAIGQPEHAQLARTCLMGTVAFLTANFFITNGFDWRLWILLGLNVALLALARRGSSVLEPAVAPEQREVALELSHPLLPVVPFSVQPRS